MGIDNRRDLNYFVRKLRIIIIMGLSYCNSLEGKSKYNYALIRQKKESLIENSLEDSLII